MTNKLAIIGDDDSVLIFSAAGVDAYPTKDADDATAVLKKIAKEYAVIFITDVLAVLMEDVIKKYNTRPYPIILSLPSENGSNGYSEKKLKDAMDKALGVDILHNDD